MKINRDKFTLHNMSDILKDIMRSYLRSQPTQVNLKLPKLKKVKESV